MPRPATKPKHPHSALIETLGVSVVREHFGLSYQRLHAWRVNGVPYTHRAAVAQMALLNGVSVPADFLAPPEAAAA